MFGRFHARWPSVLPWATVAVVAVAAAVLAAPAFGDEGNENFRSDLRSVSPAIEGLDVEVVDGDDALEVTNATGMPVLVPGYSGEPYLRIASEGKVELNLNSPAAYLNEDRYAQVDVPPRADAKAPPQWKVVGQDGVYEWHEHRIHWMSAQAPPRVEDEGEETKIFDWVVPLDVGGETVEVTGTLYWDPHSEATEAGDSGGVSGIAVAGGVVALLAVVGVAALLVLRRRRTPSDGPSEAW